MKKRELLTILKNYPLFTFNDFLKISNMNSKYAALYLFRLKKDGLIFQVEKGKYTLADDALIPSSFILSPSYISFWTALRFHNLTEQLPKEIMIASPKSKKEITFLKTKIRFYKIRNLEGYKKERYKDTEIFVAEKEKAIIDSLLAENTPFDEIIKALSQDVDSKKLAEYALNTRNQSLIKRIGYLMDFFGLDSKVLLNSINNNYILLDSLGKESGEKIRKWRIILNKNLHDIY